MWGYAVNSRAEGSSSNLEQQSKKERGWSSGRDLDVGLFQQPEPSVTARNVNRFNYMDVDAAFLEDDAADASVVTSSYHFSLSDVDSMFEQAAAAHPMKQMDWEALNNLGDMDDIFGNNSSFQQHTLEVPSVSSSPDSVMSLRVDSSPDEKQAGNVPSMAGLNKPVYWLAQQLCQEETSNLSCEDYQPPIILPPGMISDSTSLETSVPQHLQESMSYKSFQPRRDSENPVGDIVQQTCTDTVVERRATNQMASTCGGGGNLSSEATVLYQLGSTMSRLDVGTRLCIRNSLYRLAKGAMSRTVHGEESAQSTARSLRNSLETCTNPIDRTVASLLFYKQEQQQQEKQEAATSSSVSPHSTISSNCSTWPEAGCSSSDHERVTTPVAMMFGNKLPLPPVYYTNTSYPSQAEFMSSKRGRRK